MRKVVYGKVAFPSEQTSHITLIKNRTLLCIGLIWIQAGLVQDGLHLDPLSGDIFVYIGKRGNQICLLQWDGDGYLLYTKRLETGTFERPKGEKLLGSSRELMLILQGVRLTSVQLRKRCERVISC